MQHAANLLTVAQFAKEHPAFPEGGLRWQIFHEESNGLKKAGAIIRVGSKVLIDVNRYFSWIYAQNPAPIDKHPAADAEQAATG